MKKYLRYSLKGLAIFAGVLLIVYIAAYAYVASNKKSIILQIKGQVADKLNGEVQIGNISLGFLSTFPNISVLLEKVLIKDTLFSQHQHPFFRSEKVYINLSITGIIRKNNPVNGIRIENGQLYVYKDTSGYTNAYLFSPKGDTQAATKTSAKIEIDNIKLREVRLILDDQKKENYMILM
ncbi:MAG: AsmA family protein [Segetibacter sp.]